MCHPCSIPWYVFMIPQIYYTKHSTFRRWSEIFQTFNIHKGHFFDQTFCNSITIPYPPAEWARQLIKPSTDSASPLVEIEIFFLLRSGDTYGAHHKGFCLFGEFYQALGSNPMSQYFWIKIVLESRLSPKSLEPVFGFLAYLEPKLWLKNTVFDKIQGVTQRVSLTISYKSFASHN